MTRHPTQDPEKPKMYCCTEEEYGRLPDLSSTSEEIDILNNMYYRQQGNEVRCIK
jgi:hypothetical protein